MTILERCEYPSGPNASHGTTIVEFLDTGMVRIRGEGEAAISAKVLRELADVAEGIRVGRETGAP